MTCKPQVGISHGGVMCRMPQVLYPALRDKLGERYAEDLISDHQRLKDGFSEVNSMSARDPNFDGKLQGVMRVGCRQLGSSNHHVQQLSREPKDVVPATDGELGMHVCVVPYTAFMAWKTVAFSWSAEQGPVMRIPYMLFQLEWVHTLCSQMEGDFCFREC